MHPRHGHRGQVPPTGADPDGERYAGRIARAGGGCLPQTKGTGTYHPSDLQFAGEYGYQTESSCGTEPGLGCSICSSGIMNR
jgi:hypothetical protein